MSVALKRSFAVTVMVIATLTTFSANAVELIVNGDFEDTTDWGPYEVGPPPVGWTSSSNPAEQLSGTNAIGGSGTSGVAGPPSKPIRLTA